jgi:hypothetical protein
MLTMPRFRRQRDCCAQNGGELKDLDLDKRCHSNATMKKNDGRASTTGWRFCGDR